MMLIKKIKREEGVKGIHTVFCASDNEKISITHEAFTRDVFAAGALSAAQFLKDKTGIFDMRDVLSLASEK